MTADTPEQVGALKAMEELAQAEWWQWSKREGMENPGNWAELPRKMRSGWRRWARRAFVGVMAAHLWPSREQTTPRASSTQHEKSGMTEDDKKLTADAQHTAADALAKVHAWRWERMGVMTEAQEAMYALERLRVALKDAREGEPFREGQEWDPLACRWVEKGPKTGPAVQWNRTTGA